MAEKEFILIIKARDLGSTDTVLARLELRCPNCLNAWFSHPVINKSGFRISCTHCDNTYDIATLLDYTTQLDIRHV